MVEPIIKREFERYETKQLQGISVLMMVFLHLFCRKDYTDMYHPWVFIGKVPFVYYISLVCGACVPIFLFCSGYGLYSQNQDFKKNIKRINNLLVIYELVVVLTIIYGYTFSIPSITELGIWNIIKNMILLEHSICGAWWYLQTYVVLVLLSPILFRIIANCSYRIVLPLSFVLFCIGYYQRTKNLLFFPNHAIVNDVLYLISSFLFCQIAFIVGGYCRKHSTITYLRRKCNNINTICITIINTIIFIATVFIHSIIESMFIDTFIGLMFVFQYASMNISRRRTLMFFGNHSTHIWLVHMLVYQTFVPPCLLFWSRIPIIIFCEEILITIIISFFLLGIEILLGNLRKVIII